MDDEGVLPSGGGSIQQIAGLLSTAHRTAVDAKTPTEVHVACADPDGNGFASLAELLASGTSIGALATAVERFGVFGWDRFGRWRKFEPREAEAAQVLDALARTYDRLYGGAPEPYGSDLEDSPLSSFGWASGQAPDLVSIEAGLATSPLQAPSRKGENATLRLVGVLLNALLGKYGSFPQSPSEAQLIEWLSLHIGSPPPPGLSPRNLQSKFAQAKRLLALSA